MPVGAISTKFYLKPEWNLPRLKPSDAGAAVAPTVVDGSTLAPPTNAKVGVVATSMDDWIFESDGRGNCSASLYPFWGVRRETAKALQLANEARKTFKDQSFNCSLKTKNLTNVCVGVVNDEQVGGTRIVEVPFMTNHVAVEKGEELLMEQPEQVAVKPKKPKAARTWKDAEASKQKKLQAQSLSLDAD